MNRSTPSYKFRVVNPAYYLDSLLFWSVYVSTTMAILWLLASTAKNQIREIMIDKMISIEVETVEVLSHFYSHEHSQVRHEGFAAACNIIKASNPSVIGIAIVRKENDQLLLVEHIASENHKPVNFISDEHTPFLEKAAKGGRPTLSDWEIFNSGAATLLTPVSRPVEYLYTIFPKKTSHQADRFLIIALDAVLIQKSFNKMDDLAITAISLSVILATIIAILIRYRSAQRLKANEEKLAALDSLKKRDVLLGYVIRAADDLLGQADVNNIFLELLVRLKKELSLSGLLAAVSLKPGQPLTVDSKLRWINQQKYGSIPIDSVTSADLSPEWLEELKNGEPVIVRRKEGPAVFRMWMASNNIEVMALIGMHREGQLNGIIVALEKRERNILDPSLVGILKLTADIFSAAYQQREQEARMIESSKMEALGRVAGGVAHEFNNLLHIITGNLRTGRGENAEFPKDSERNDRILEAAGRGARIVEQLLRATRLNKPDLEVRDLNLLVEKTVSLARLAVGGGIRIEIDLDSELSHVLMDEAQIQQVILNLVLNARDSIGEDGQIIVKTAQTDQHVLCEVIDNGEGISEEIKQRLFEPFFTTKEPGKGTGLGLSTSQGILKQHGGFIEAHNLDGGGCCFRFGLPAADHKKAGSVQSESSLDVSLIPKGEVLIADDEQMCRQVLKECLLEKEIQIREFESGQPLIDYVKQAESEVSWIITDWTMPGVHGEELIKQLKQANPKAKIFVTSGFVLEKQKVAGVDGFINKPFGPDELFQEVARVLIQDQQ